MSASAISSGVPIAPVFARRAAHPLIERAHRGAAVNLRIHFVFHAAMQRGAVRMDQITTGRSRIFCFGFASALATISGARKT